MSVKARMSAFSVWLTAAILACNVLASAQTLQRKLVTQDINEQNVVRLTGNTRPEMTRANDRGPVSNDLVLEHMYLLLNRSPEQEQAADTLVSQLHDAKSQLYHHWLTSDQVASEFGPSADDVKTITAWLESHGFTVNNVYLANGVVDFSGSAGS